MKKLKDLEKYETVLIRMEKSRFWKKVVMDIFKSIKNKPTIYISLVAPYKFLYPLLKKINFEVKNVYIIDCITKSVSSIIRKEKNIFCVDNPADLTSLAICIGQFLEAIEGKKFILIDSFRILTLYNDEKVVKMFMKVILEKAAKNNATTILLIPEKDYVLWKNTLDKKFKKIIKY